jgi:molybdate transport system substrate-binding protein
MPRTRLAATVAALLSALLAAACGGSSATAPSNDSLSGQLTVFAAASLTDAFNQEGQAFTKRHPGVQLRFSYGGSPTLAAQIRQGAPADVFASADQPNMKKITAAGLNTGTPQAFAGNRLQIVVGKGNPKHVTSLQDLANPRLLVDLCNPEVPCGNYARQALARAGVTVHPRSGETAVTGVVTKVGAAEADAGIVYRTDVMAAGAKVDGVDIPDRYDVPATYPIVALKASHQPAAAGAFIDFVRGKDGQTILRRHGFGSPRTS